MNASSLLKTANQLLWGGGTLLLLLGTGAFLMLRFRLLPLRNLGRALRMAMGRHSRQNRQHGVTPFASLMTMLAATIGTGNIVGVATALTAGGPGALLWMELSALLGLATKLAECTLAVQFRQKDPQGNWQGGPMYVMRSALGRLGHPLGRLFAIFALLASFGLGSTTQANSMAEALHFTWAVPPAVTGIVTTVLALFITLGGIRSISRITTVVVPVMGVLYLSAGAAVIFVHAQQLPQTLLTIFREAVSTRAVCGGAAGTLTAAWFRAARWGVARGVFSNEAGLGSAAISAACADTDSPARQGYISMTSVFFDTTVICTVTGLAICCSGVLGSANPGGTLIDGAALTIAAFETALGDAGRVLISISIVLFAFATILGWAYQGEQAAGFLLGSRVKLLYRVLFCLSALWGATAELDVVFALSDLCNAMMCLPNLVCLLLLSGTASAEIFRFQQKFHTKFT